MGHSEADVHVGSEVGLLPADVAPLADRRGGGADGRGMTCLCCRVPPTVELAWQYVRTSIRRDKRSFWIGLAAVTLVVGVCSVIQSAVSVSPVIFLKIAEDTAGETDLMILPSFAAAAAEPVVPACAEDRGGLPIPLLNHSDIRERLRGNGDVVGSAPRWILLGSVLNAENASRNTTATLLAYNSDVEARIGLGRTWKRRKLGCQEAYVSESATDEVGVRGARGDRIRWRADLNALLGLASGGGGGGFTAEAALQVLELLGVNTSALGTVDVSVGETLRALVAAGGLEDAVVIPAALDGATITVNGTLLLEGALVAALGGGGADGAAGEADGFVLVDVRGERHLVLQQEVTVLEAIRNSHGKWPAALGNTAALEAECVAELVRDSLLGVLDTAEQLFGAVLGPGLVDVLRGAREAAAAFGYADMEQAAIQVSVQYAQRMDLYLERSNDVGEGMNDFSDSVVSSLGTDYPATYLTPLGSSLAGVRFIKLFLDQIFSAVVFVLALVGVMVIYALILGDVESRTYEYGMLRALGMDQSTLLYVLSLSTAVFAIPGIVLGLLLASLLYVLVAAMVAQFAAIEIEPVLRASAWIYGVALGVLVPALANVLPVRRALGAALRDALDLYHQSAAEVVVTVRHLESLGLEPATLMLAVMLTLVGFITYFVLPFAFAIDDFALFLGVLNGILMAMLLGLALVVQIIQPAVERALLNLLVGAGGGGGGGDGGGVGAGVAGSPAASTCSSTCSSTLSSIFSLRWPCCPRDGRFYLVVSKNLAGHRPRNRKTAWMISMSTAFLVFAGSMFALQSASLGDNVRRFVGADVLVRAPGSSAVDGGLPQQALSDLLDTQKALGKVEQYTFVSFGLDLYAPMLSSTIGNLALSPQTDVTIYGVQTNYLDTAFRDYATVPEVATSASASGDARDDRRTQSARWVAANPIEALELGRGQLELDIERGGAQPAGVVLSAPWAAARFACNGSDDAAQQWARFADCLSNCLPQPQSLCRTVYPALNRSALDAAARATYADYQDLIVSEAYRDFSGIDVQTPLLLALATRDPDTSLGNDQVRLGKARAMAAMLPGFPLFSSYSQAAWFAPALTSMRAFSRLLGAVSQSLADDIADGTAVYKNADGDITGTMAAPPSSTSPPTPSPSSNASSSEATWRGGNGTAGGAGWGVEVRPAEALLAGNVSFLADGAVATFGRVAVADGEPATAVSWDLGQCLVVDAVRLWLGDNSTRPPAVPPAQPTAFAFTLQSRSGPGGALVDHAVSASAAAVVGGDAGVLLTLALAEPFSARLWSLGVRDRARAGRPRAEWDVAEVQVHAAPAGVCASGGGGDQEPDVPKARLLVKLRPGISLRQTREVVNGVRSLLPDDSFTVVSTNELLLTTESAIFGLTFFFDFIAVVVGVLIFLASVVSWTATVHENSVEVGILRALGLSSAETTRVFVYEALAVVLASFLLGAAVGFAIAAAITLQFNLFTEMPFILRVPWVTLLLTFLIFVATAIFAAGIPARTIATAKIASVVKGRLDAAKD